MNKKELALKVRDTMRKYREQGSDSPCRKNHIVLNAGNTTIHEMIKCGICLGLLNGQIPMFVAELTKNVVTRKSADFKKLSFITEAVDRRTGKRRDIVILELDQIIEVVNTHMDDALMKEYKADDVLAIRV